MALPLTEQDWNAMSPNEKAFFKTMGRRIAQRRQELGLTQVRMAEILDIPQQTYASYEVGKHGFPIALLPALASTLGTEVGALLGLTDKTQSKRGPAPRFQQHIEQISRLPKAKQQVVLQMLEGVLTQHSR